MTLSIFNNEELDGVSVSYEYNTQQLIYKEESNLIPFKQIVYKDLDLTFPMEQKIYSDHFLYSVSYPIKIIIYDEDDLIVGKIHLNGSRELTIHLKGVV